MMHLRHASAEYQLSVYPCHGSQYVRHRDAFPDDGSDEHQRRVRALFLVHGMLGFHISSCKGIPVAGSRGWHEICGLSTSVHRSGFKGHISTGHRLGPACMLYV